LEEMRNSCFALQPNLMLTTRHFERDKSESLSIPIMSQTSPFSLWKDLDTLSEKREGQI